MRPVDESCFLCNALGFIKDEIGVRTCYRCKGEGVLTTSQADALASEIRAEEKYDEAREKQP
jgi:hypothetical protein